MMRDAETHAEEDRRRREVIDARNQADSLVYSVEKTLADNRQKLQPGDVEKIEAAISALREATGKEDAAAIRKGIDDLQRAAHSMAETLYRGASAAGEQPGGQEQGAGGEGDGRSREGEVIDAEVVDDEKR